ncbi:MAG: DUF4145 domain-containing protein [Pseudomonadota bacterium]
MRTANKDASEVVAFRSLFAQLRERIGDDPTDLARMAATDESIDELCRRLSSAGQVLRSRERAGPALFTAPVDPDFIGDWRDFEARYESIVDEIAWRWLFEQLNIEHSASVGSEADRLWTQADLVAEDAAEGFEFALGFAREQVSQEHRFSEDFVEDVEDGLDEWERLKGEVGFDLRGVFRRRRLTPFTLVPRHVAAKYGSSGKASMLSNLRAAHDAFVFGAPLAALAMMRSILEAVLRDHYGAPGKDLNERINKAQHLPRRAPREALHRLRRRANIVLHLDKERAESLPDLDGEGMEREVVSLLFVLRALIEEAPARA